MYVIDINKLSLPRSSVAKLRHTAFAIVTHRYVQYKVLPNGVMSRQGLIDRWGVRAQTCLRGVRHRYL